MGKEWAQDGEAWRLTTTSALRVARAASLPARQLVKAAINYQGLRSFWLRLAAFDAFRSFAPAVAVEIDGIRYYLGTKDWSFSRVVFGLGSYDKEVMAYALNIAEQGRATPLLEGRIFLDVGANIGTSSIPAIKVFGAREALAFEPELENYKLLRCNVIANDLETRIHTFRMGLSDHAGIGELERSGDSWGDHRIRTQTTLPDGIYEESLRTTVSVPLARMDDLVRDLLIDLDQVGVLWMDVQGHEAHVLAGATTILSRDIPVIMEYWPYGLRRAGGLSTLRRLVADNYERVVDVRASMREQRIVEVPASELVRLEEVYEDATQFTDLVLLQ